MTRIHTRKAIDERGEIFSGIILVNMLLDGLNQEKLLNPNSLFRDGQGCGNGNILIEVLRRRMKDGASHLDVLKNIRGVEINEDNVAECKQRLAMGSIDADVWTVLNHNIICADALDSTHSGWEDVGYMWSRFKEWQTIDGALQPKQKASVLSNIRKRFHYN
jgi:hypothetical protein